MSGSSDFWKNITKPTGTGKLTVAMGNRAWYQILVKVHPDLADDAMRRFTASTFGRTFQMTSPGHNVDADDTILSFWDGVEAGSPEDYAMWRNGNPNITAWDDMTPAAREQWSSARRNVFPGSA